MLFERKVEGLMTKPQMRRLADELAADINRTRERNRRTREAHWRRRLRELAQAGIECSRLPCCDVQRAL